MMIDRESFYTITTIIFLILTLITIVFSLLTISIIIINWRIQCRSITNLFICNSCVTLLYYAIATIIEISFMSKINKNTTFCQIRAAIHLSACIIAALSYLVQAISRYFVTILYKYKILLTFRINWILIIISWIISFILPALMFISPKAYQYESESRMCFLTNKVFQTSFPIVIVVFCIPLNIIIFLYALIIRHATRKNLINSNTIVILQMKRNIKVFQNILISVTILTIGGTPYFSSVIINRITKVPWKLYTLSILFMSLSAALNSLALFSVNKQVRTYFFQKIKCQKEKNTNQRVQIRMIKNNQTMPQSIQMLPTFT